jgi:hypothetical protein
LEGDNSGTRTEISLQIAAASSGWLYTILQSIILTCRYGYQRNIISADRLAASHVQSEIVEVHTALAFIRSQRYLAAEVDIRRQMKSGRLGRKVEPINTCSSPHLEHIAENLIIFLGLDPCFVDDSPAGCMSFHCIGVRPLSHLKAWKRFEYFTSASCSQRKPQ